MAAHKCNDCELIFPHAEALQRDESNLVARPEHAIGPGWITQCPECRSEDLEDVTLCATCGDTEPEDGDDFCADCRVLEDALDSVKKEVAQLAPDLPEILKRIAP